MPARSTANPNGSHPMQRTMAAREAQRQRFAAWLVELVNSRGVPAGTPGQPHRHRVAWLVQQGLARHSVLDWLKGNAIPTLHTLPSVAEKLGVTLNELCDATGRPPTQEATMRFTTDRDGALSTLIHRWRTSNGWTHAQLAEHSGLCAATLSRMESGSMVYISTKLAVPLADALGVTVAEVAIACRALALVPEDLDIQAQRFDQPLASLLRRSRKTHGLSRAESAAALGISDASLAAIESGRGTANVQVLLRAAVHYGFSLRRLLMVAGHAADMAEAIAMSDALEAAEFAHVDQPFANVLRSARVRAHMTTYALAAMVGTDRFVVSRYQNGAAAPDSLAKVLKFASALETEPAPLVAAWVARAA